MITRQAIEEIVVGVVMGTFLGVAVFFASPDANASPGYDPYGDRDTICRTLDRATSVNDVKNLFDIYGAQEVTDTSYAGCKQHALKIISALQS